MGVTASTETEAGQDWEGLSDESICLENSDVGVLGKFDVGLVSPN